MAADLTQPVSTPAEPPPSPSRLPGRRRNYRLRFVVVYSVLAAVLGVALAGFVLLVARPGHHSSATWSVWKPAVGDPDTVVKEIADHVSHEYRLPSGGQLVGVVAGPPAVQSIQIKAIAVRSAPGSNSNISILPTENSEMYILCGLGQRCSIASGKPTQARGRVLRRETLELALYTFKFVPRIDSIIAFLPPRPGANPEFTVFLRKADLSRELKRPLRVTLPRAKAPTPAEADVAEVQTIDRLTLPSMFRYSLTQSQEGSAILVLDPLALGG